MVETNKHWPVENPEILVYSFLHRHNLGHSLLEVFGEADLGKRKLVYSQTNYLLRIQKNKKMFKNLGNQSVFFLHILLFQHFFLLRYIGLINVAA